MSKELKEKLMAMLCALSLIPRGFTGKLTFNIGQGALLNVERVELLK
jgi:hypothetical protein